MGWKIEGQGKGGNMGNTNTKDLLKKSYEKLLKI